MDTTLDLLEDSAAASFLVNFGVFGEKMARVRDALIDVYGFTPEQIAFGTTALPSVRVVITWVDCPDYW